MLTQGFGSGCARGEAETDFSIILYPDTNDEPIDDDAQDADDMGRSMQDNTGKASRTGDIGGHKGDYRGRTPTICSDNFPNI